jgi:deoxyribose-phosphate aldolase
VDRALDCLVDAGACRFGVRAARPADAGFSACDLAPPLARMIDHTALKPQTTESDIRELCDEARQYCFASVCVSPSYVPLAADLLRGTPVATCTVIGFPHGATQTSTKAAEAERAILDGATEVDMVINVGMHKSGRYTYVEDDIRAVVTTARGTAQGIVVKVILETALLTDREKVIACVLAQNAGADFVKTSTGFAKGGATEQDIAMMRRAVGPAMGVKASGGVRSTDDAERMIARGATRIGASASVAIIKGEQGGGGY